MKRTLAVLGFSLCLTTPVFAGQTTYNRISLQAEASTQVPHDLMHVTLFTEQRNQDTARLAEDVTLLLNQAIQTSKQAPAVKVSMGNRSSSPVYDEKGTAIIAWRERAELRLESTDFAQLSELTGQLLGSLSMGSMRFSVDNATRLQHENELLEQAIAAFNARAQLVTQSLNAHSYKLVNLNLNSQGGYPPPLYARSVMMSPKMADEAVSPQIEAGDTLLKMTADGVIEVQHSE